MQPGAHRGLGRPPHQAGQGLLTVTQPVLLQYSSPDALCADSALSCRQLVPLAVALVFWQAPPAHASPPTRAAACRWHRLDRFALLFDDQVNFPAECCRASLGYVVAASDDDGPRCAGAPGLAVSGGAAALPSPCMAEAADARLRWPPPADTAPALSRWLQTWSRWPPPGASTRW